MEEDDININDNMDCADMNVAAGYYSASGPIEYGFTNDFMFRCWRG